jgi:hypothetical protein
MIIRIQERATKHGSGTTINALFLSKKRKAGIATEEQCQRQLAKRITGYSHKACIE